MRADHITLGVIAHHDDLVPPDTDSIDRGGEGALVWLGVSDFAADDHRGEQVVESGCTQLRPLNVRRAVRDHREGLGLAELLEGGHNVVVRPTRRREGRAVPLGELLI